MTAKDGLDHIGSYQGTSLLVPIEPNNGVGLQPLRFLLQGLKAHFLRAWSRYG